MNKTTQQFKEYIEAHPEQSKQSASVTKAAIDISPLTYPIEHKNKIETTETLQIPKFFTQDDKKLFEEISETMLGIFRKVIKAYKEDPEFRKLFHFSPELHDMIMSEVLCDADIPILRVDIFFDEDTKDFYFCEFNADGTSSMAENDVMAGLMTLNNAWRALQPKVQYKPLVEAYGTALLDIYKRTTGKDNPSIVMTDFLENAYKTDFDVFKIFFESRGFDFDIADIRDLEYNGEKLYNKKTGRPYDLVYRRSVTTDMLDHKDEIQPLLKAVEDKNVVFVGPYSTQIPHSKVINEVLQDEAIQNILTAEEVEFLEKHLPKTFYLDEKALNTILEDKNKWIIKPKEGYGSMDVYPGADLTEEEWEKVARDHVDSGFIVQQFIPHYQSENIEPLKSDKFRNYSNTTGLYIFDGKFAGILQRMSDGNVVSSQYNRKMVPTFFTVDE